MTLESSVLNNSNKFQTNYNKSMEQYRQMKQIEKQARRKSFVLEFREIKKEIEQELKKEKQDRLRQEKAQTNINTIDSMPLRKKEMSPLKPKRLRLNDPRKTISQNDSLTLSSKKISIKRIKPHFDEDFIEEQPRLKQRLQP
jgi:hypothetical protein